MRRTYWIKKWGRVDIFFTSKGISRIFLTYNFFERGNNFNSSHSLTSRKSSYFKVLEEEVRERLERYFKGEVIEFSDLPLDVSMISKFEEKVYTIIRKIPYGETRNYRWVAEEAGKPKASRVVGKILAKNPIPIIIPCHRVIRSDGFIGGWSGPPGWKEKLLFLEGATFKF